MKTFSYSGNESVSWRKDIFRITVKDDIALQFSWYFEISKEHSNFVRLLHGYAPNPFDWYFNVWDLIEPFERHANSNKRIETTGR